MAEVRSCAECGAAIEESGRELYCVRCLLAMALSPTRAMGGETLTCLDPQGPQGRPAQNSVPEAICPGAQLGFYTIALPGLLFLSSRKSNGYAALHDRASRTRVIRRAARSETGKVFTPALAPRVRLPEMIGPYELLERLRAGPEDELWLGFDPQLRRTVWIHRQNRGASPRLSGSETRHGRGQLHCLGGRQEGDRVWSAYEHRPGTAFLDSVGQAQPWARVRTWLLDLAKTLEEVQNRASAPLELSLARIWITHDDHAVWLDFAAPSRSGNGAGVQPASTGPGPGGPTEFPRFLHRAACAALDGRLPPAGEVRAPRNPVLPLHARAFLAHVALPHLESAAGKPNEHSD